MDLDLVNRKLDRPTRRLCIQGAKDFGESTPACGQVGHGSPRSPVSARDAGTRCCHSHTQPSDAGRPRSIDGPQRDGTRLRSTAISLPIRLARQHRPGHTGTKECGWGIPMPSGYEQTEMKGGTEPNRLGGFNDHGVVRTCLRAETLPHTCAASQCSSRLSSGQELDSGSGTRHVPTSLGLRARVVSATRRCERSGNGLSSTSQSARARPRNNDAICPRIPISRCGSAFPGRHCSGRRALRRPWWHATRWRRGVLQNPGDLPLADLRCLRDHS